MDGNDVAIVILVVCIGILALHYTEVWTRRDG
jgi:hypothetical protein